MERLMTPDRLAVVVVGAGIVTSPVVALLNRIIVGSEIRPDAERSLRQAFWVRKVELTPWGIRARAVFRGYWLALAATLGALLVRSLVP